MFNQPTRWDGCPLCERDQYKMIAEINADTIKQMQDRDAAEHEAFIARFGL
jgi:hypothetical protein